MLKIFWLFENFSREDVNHSFLFFNSVLSFLKDIFIFPLLSKFSLNSLSSFWIKENLLLRETFCNLSFSRSRYNLSKAFSLIHHNLKKKLPYLYYPLKQWNTCWHTFECSSSVESSLLFTSCCHHWFFFFIFLKLVDFFFEWNLLPLIFLNLIYFINFFGIRSRSSSSPFFLFIINCWSFECHIILLHWFNFLMIFHGNLLSHV